MAKVLLCYMTNGKAVYYEDETSHVATHLADTPGLYQLIQGFLSKQNFHEHELQVEYDFGKIIGSTDLVETDDADDVVYAKRLNRDTFTRFVRNKDAPPTRYITVHLMQDKEGDYELLSAWMGRISPPFPDDPNAVAESLPYWNTHALVFGHQAIQKDTLTKEVPW